MTKTGVQDYPRYKYAVRLTVNGKGHVLPQVMVADNDASRARKEALSELSKLTRQLKREGFNVRQGGKRA